MGKYFTFQEVLLKQELVQISFSIYWNFSVSNHFYFFLPFHINSNLNRSSTLRHVLHVLYIHSMCASITGLETPKVLTCLSSLLPLGGWNQEGGSKPLPLLPQLVCSGADRWRDTSERHPAGILPMLHPPAAAGERHTCGHPVLPHPPAQQPAGPAGHRQQVAQQVGAPRWLECKSFPVPAIFLLWYLISEDLFCLFFFFFKFHLNVNVFWTVK